MYRQEGNIGSKNLPAACSNFIVNIATFKFAHTCTICAVGKGFLDYT